MSDVIGFPARPKQEMGPLEQMARGIHPEQWCMGINPAPEDRFVRIQMVGAGMRRRSANEPLMWGPGHAG